MNTFAKDKERKKILSAEIIKLKESVRIASDIDLMNELIRTNSSEATRIPEWREKYLVNKLAKLREAEQELDKVNYRLKTMGHYNRLHK